jgi:lipopolysaccharide export LptBFGC system permease protein LptF
VFLVDYVEFISKDRNKLIPFLMGVKIIVYRAPYIVESFSQFIILLSSAIVIEKLSLKNELTILYINGFSLWRIITLFSIVSILISCFNIFIAAPIFINASKTSKKIELLHRTKENVEFIDSNNGIWFEQLNPKTNEKMILRASRVYIEDMIFKDNILLILDGDGNFIKRLNIDELKLFDGFWFGKNAFTMERSKPIIFLEQITLNTNLKKDFILQRLRNRYENINYMNIYQLIKFNKAFGEYKLEHKKFSAKINAIFASPFVFVLMCFISAIFTSNSVRKNTTVIEMFSVVAVGIAFFIIQNTICEIVLAGKISIFYIWRMLLLFFTAFGRLLIKKINLKNF